MAGDAVFNPRLVRQSLHLHIGKCDARDFPRLPVAALEAGGGAAAAVEAIEGMKDKKAWRSILLRVGEGVGAGEAAALVKRLADATGDPVEVATGGGLFSRSEDCEEICEAGAGLFRLGLHGMKSATHDRIAGRPGDFQKARRALKNLALLRKRRGAEVSVHFFLDSENLCEIEHAVERIFGEEIEISRFSHFIEDFFVPEIDELHFQRIGAGRPGLRETVEAFRRAFENRDALDQTEIFLDYLPFCAMEGLEGRVFHPLTVAARFAGGGEIQLLFDNRARVDKCSGCAYESLCPGIEPDIAGNPGEMAFILGLPTPAKVPDDFLRRLKDRDIPFPAPPPMFIHPTNGSVSIDGLKLSARLGKLEEKIQKTRRKDSRFRLAIELGELNEKAGDFEKALRWLNEAAKAMPGEGIARIRIARLLWRMDRWEEALNAAKAAAELDLTPDCRGDLDNFLESAKRDR